MRTASWLIPIVAATLALSACAPRAPRTGAAPAKPRLTQYTEVTLTSDLSRLSEKERRMIPILIDACRAMDDIFWLEACGDRDSLLAGIHDSTLRRFAVVNYGPWDRLAGNAPFLPGVGAKPPGAGFYPADMTKEEFEKAVAESPARATALKSEYTVVRRDAQGALVAIPYHVAFRAQVERAAALLRQAAALAQDAGLRRYLQRRATALLTDDYRPSDLAWMDMKTNGVDVVIGPIETYEDALFGYKASHEGFVLIKDREWSQRLARYAKLLPDLQRQLPVSPAYRKESPGSGSDLNAYDVVYYAGDADAGGKTIAINLPNAERVQFEKGTRRLQLENSVRAKFDRILAPIADRLIARDQRKHVQFDAFFANVMFHEVAHGLGIKHTLDGKGTVREALKDQAGAMEEGKADVLGLFLIEKLAAMGEPVTADVMDNYVTYLASLFRSVRFGAADAHGRANLAEFGFFQRHGAFTRDKTNGTYRVDPARMRAAIDAYSDTVLTLQGNGDYPGARAFLPRASEMDSVLKVDLARLATADIPTDIVFRQGMDVLQAATPAAH
jgi:hypothetical protein